VFPAGVGQIEDDLHAVASADADSLLISKSFDVGASAGAERVGQSGRLGKDA
jgi:hypothetical protein